MIIVTKKKLLFSCLLVCGMFIQKVQAQKETFFHNFNWNQGNYASAGGGARGAAINSLYRNYNDSINYYFSTDIPVAKINSSFGVYYLHNTSAEQQKIQAGLSYTAFINLGANSSLRAGIQGNRHQQALSQNPWAFKEYKTDTSYYTYDVSLFLKRGKLSLGLSAEDILFRQPGSKTDYVALLGFDELRANDWLQSSPYMMARFRQNSQIPEWRFNYTATIANTVLVGASYYRNSDYLYGLNAGFKLFNRLWLTAATDFVDTKLPYRAIYEFGIRILLSKKVTEAESIRNHSQEYEDQFYDEFE